MILATVVWGGQTFLFWNLSKQNDEIDRLRSDLDLYEGRYSDLRETVNFVEGSEERIKGVEDLLLARKEQDIVSFIEKVEDLGKRSGVEWEMSKLSIDEKDEENFLTFKLETFGDWESVNKAIASLELLPYRVSIKEAQLNWEEGAWTSSVVVSVLLLD